ncbi:DUF1524 domain-containing protein [Streptomyces sp. NPDC050560]|uniref:GmrSD restriction endonuclease domain-containing protein n=1 Tax=Streptomyces sp. NPDC050560 TaxID=3365630 RepID=UPI0037955957
MRKRLGILAASAALSVGTIGLAPAAMADPPPPPAESTAREYLADLTVATPHSMDGYSRDAFDIWASQGDGCTTRQAVLARDGDDVVDEDGDCQPESGSWYSAYDGTTQTVVAQATIDHVVPLAEAWRSGADDWTADQRKAFGNDLDDPQLIVASESSNSSKSDSGPADWKPEDQAFWCTYAEDYTSIKHTFALTTTDDEVTALGDMLDTCS